MKRNTSILRLTRFFLTLSISVIFSLYTKGQTDSVKLVKYTPEFEFKEGIYLNFDQVRNNNPIPKSRLLTGIDYSDPDYFEKILNQKSFFFYDRFGIKQEVKMEDIWGFSRNGILYISIDDKFNRITIIGTICHFVATITTYDTRYYDPYSYGYNPYDYYYGRGSQPMNTASSEMRQYIMEFETGKIMEYSVTSLEVILMKDPELHDEFTQLSKKKQKQLKFLYLRKFNERNPLFIPVSQF